MFNSMIDRKHNKLVKSFNGHDHKNLNEASRRLEHSTIDDRNNSSTLLNTANKLSRFQIENL